MENGKLPANYVNAVCVTYDENWLIDWLIDWLIGVLRRIGNISAEKKHSLIKVSYATCFTNVLYFRIVHVIIYIICKKKI